VTTHAVERLGARLVYEIVGEGMPAIVVPGGPGFGSTYLHDSLARLADGHRRLIFIDQRGSGRSSGHQQPELLTMTAFVDDLECIRSAIGEDRIDLIGHSFGGLQSLFYALAHPDRLRRLVLVESDPPTFQEWRRFRDVVAERRTEQRDSVLQSIESRESWRTDPASVEAYFRTYLQSYFGRSDCASRLAFGFTADSLDKMAVTTRAIREDLGDWDIRTALRSLTTPALVIYGTHSIFPHRAVLSMQDALPHARFEMMEDVGHFPFLEDANAFSRIVQDFLIAR